MYRVGSGDQVTLGFYSACATCSPGKVVRFQPTTASTVSVKYIFLVD